MKKIARGVQVLRDDLAKTFRAIRKDNPAMARLLHDRIENFEEAFALYYSARTGLHESFELRSRAHTKIEPEWLQ